MRNTVSKLIAGGSSQASPFIEFAKKHSLVFTNDASEHKDPIQGITFSKATSDKYFVQGVSQGHDIAVIQRTIPMFNSKSNMKWAVLQLSTNATMPHTFIDGHKHPKDVYESAFTAFGHYRDLTDFINQTVPHFGNHFTVYGAVEESEFIRQTLNKDILELIYNHGANLDYETDQHHIRIYNLTNNLSAAQLEDMFVLAQNIVHHSESSA